MVWNWLNILQIINAKKSNVFVKHYAPGGSSLKKLFLAQRWSQGNWPWCQLKGHHCLSMHAKYEVSTSYNSKVIANVKVDNRQTNKQTDRQDKNNMPPSFDLGALKSLVYYSFNPSYPKGHMVTDKLWGTCLRLRYGPSLVTVQLNLKFCILNVTHIFY